MRYRKRMSRRSSKKSFRRGAKRVHKRNFRMFSQRGGIRL